MKATVLDLRYRTKDVLKAVERGESVTVLYRGKAKAVIQPVPNGPKSGKLSADKSFGMWRDRKDLADVPSFVRRLRKSRFGDL